MVEYVRHSRRFSGELDFVALTLKQQVWMKRSDQLTFSVCFLLVIVITIS